LPDKIVDWLPGLLPSAGLFLRTTNHVFIHNSHDLGLVSIGGEVFAYEKQHQNVPPGEHGQWIRLIGRSLLGSKPIVHRGPEPVLVLPVGPVTRLLQPINQGGTNEQPLFVSPATNRSNNQHHVINAPAMLFCSPDGKKMELIVAPNRCIAPWHRGMYNTVPQSWTGGTGQVNTQTDTLVIGWWPRYPSGLPNRQAAIWSAGPQKVSELMRCRMYAWMGFPIRFHDTWLTGGNGLIDIEMFDDGVGTYNVLASALDQGFAWDESITNSFTLNPSGTQDASSIFSRYQRQPVDGVEVRVRWEYRLPPADPTQGGGGLNSNPAALYLDRVATAGNTSPMIGKVKLRARAPAKILNVEETR
jgi:hypothetical protein